MQQSNDGSLQHYTRLRPNPGLAKALVDAQGYKLINSGEVFSPDNEFMCRVDQNRIQAFLRDSTRRAPERNLLQQGLDFLTNDRPVEITAGAIPNLCPRTQSRGRNGQ